MAAGDYVIRRNNANTDTIPNAGSTLDLLWDTSVATNGSIISYTAATGVFTLSEAGHYLVMYSDQYGTESTTNNERLNVRSTLFLDDGGTGTFSRIEPGNGTGYIRKGSGSQEYINYGCGIIDVSADSDLKVQYERIDNTVGAGQEPDRVANDRSGIHILKLSDDLNYGIYESSANTSTSATDGTQNQINLQSTVEQDTPFTRTTNSIDIATTNPVLVLYSLRAEFGAGGRSEFQSFLRLNGTTLINRSINQTYIRQSDNTVWGGMSGAALINPTSGDDLDLVVISREAGGEAFRATVQLVELPTTTKQAITTQDTETGNLNAVNTAFNYGTSDTIDTDVFTYTATNTNIDVDVAGDYLAFAGLGTTTASTAVRAVPAISFTVNGTELQTAGNSSYSRGSGTAAFGAMQLGAILNGLSVNDSIRVLADRIGTATTAVTAVGGLQLIQMSSIIPDSAVDYELSGEGATFGPFTGGDATFTIDNPNIVLAGLGAIFGPFTGGDATISAGSFVEYELETTAGGTFGPFEGGIAYIQKLCGAADFTDNYVIAGGAGDDFDAEETTNWTVSTGALNTFAASSTGPGPLQGTNSLQLNNDGAETIIIRHEIGVGNGFNILENNFSFWFYYVKGKGANILDTPADSLQLRLYFGGTTDFATYNLGGDSTFQFGWQLLTASGRETNGGSFNFTDTDANWSREVRRVELVFDWANSNTQGAENAAIRLDCFHVGNTIRVESGTAANPATFEQLVSYVNGPSVTGGRSGFPIGGITIKGNLVEVKHSLQIGTSTCTGWLAETGKTILFNQLSDDVEFGIEVNQNSGITFGEKEVGARSYAVRGCQVLKPSGKLSNITVNDRGTFQAYNTKFFRWRDLTLGVASDTDSVADIDFVQVDSCELLNLRASNTFTKDLEVYNSTTADTNYAVELSVSPKSTENFLIHDTNEAIYFSETLTLENLKSQDNVNYDVVVKEGKTITLENSTFDETKIKRIP